MWNTREDNVDSVYALNSDDDLLRTLEESVARSCEHQNALCRCTFKRVRHYLTLLFFLDRVAQ